MPKADEIQAGDLVTRDGTDVQRVIWNDGDLLEVECVREALGYLDEDGTRGTPWCRIGDREPNLTRRYRPAGEVFDGSATQIVGLPLAAKR